MEPTSRAKCSPAGTLCLCPTSDNKMPWPWSSSPSDKDKEGKLPGPGVRTVSWNESLDVKDWDHYKDPRTWVPAFVVTTVLLGGLKIYRTYLRRIPSVNYVLPHHFHRRTLFGRVTSVGDGDGFHLYHTPGGRLAGWGWLRTIPTDKKQLKGQTVRFDRALTFLRTACC